MSYIPKKYKNIIRELAKSDTKDRIIAYYLAPDYVKLSEKDEIIRQRWSACFQLLNNYHSVQQAVAVMQKTYHISEASAYRDCRSAIEIFGDVTKSNKEAYRHILFEYSMKIFQLAATKNDLTEMNKALASMIKIKGIDKEDPDAFDFSKLQANTFEVSIPDNQLHYLESLTNSGVINIDINEH